MKKIIAVVLVLVMATTLFAGCGIKKNVTMDDINANTNVVVGKIGDQDIYAYELIFDMKRGATKEQALQQLLGIKVMLQKAKELGITISDEEYNTLVEEEWKSTAEQFESEEVFLKELEKFGITAAQYKEIIKMNITYSKVGEEIDNRDLFGKATEEDVRDFYNNNFLGAKHILFSKLDDAQQPLSDDEVKAKKAKAEDVLAKIKAGAAFEDFQNLSEDPGLETSPNGYIFLNSQSETLKADQDLLVALQEMGMAYGIGEMTIMVPEFEQGTAAIGVNEVSEIVESEYGFHIIKRIDLHADPSIFEGLRSVLDYVINSLKYTGFIEGWIAEYKQSTNEYYEALEVEPAPQEVPVQQEVVPEEGEEAHDHDHAEAEGEAADKKAE